MPTDNIDQLAHELLLAWLYYKEKSLEKAGVRVPSVSLDRVKALYGTAFQGLASLISGWDMPPRLVMQALWAHAVSLRHYQGPYSSNMASPNVVRRALSRYLGIPLEAVVEQTSRKAIVAKIEADYISRLPGMLQAAKSDALSFAMSPNFPASYRLAALMYDTSLSRSDLSVLAVDALSEADNDARMLSWLDSRGISFERLANLANQEEALESGPRAELIDLLQSATQAAKSNASFEEIHTILKQAGRITNGNKSKVP